MVFENGFKSRYSSYVNLYNCYFDVIKLMIIFVLQSINDHEQR